MPTFLDNLCLLTTPIKQKYQHNSVLIPPGNKLMHQINYKTLNAGYRETSDAGHS